MSLPAGWPDPAAVETLPTVWLALDGSAWPPATDGRPAGTVPVASWSVERELVGSVLPGNVRARSGLSIGSADVTLAQMATEPLAPWAADASRRVVPGARADLYATHDGHDDAARVNLGDWVVAPTSGSLLSPGVDVDLLERPYMGRAQDQKLPPFEFLIPCDPIWPVSVLAGQVGYHSVPPPVEGAIWAAPFTGSPAPVAGTVDTTDVYPGGAAIGTLSEWGTSSGAIGPAEHALMVYTFTLGTVEDRDSFVTADPLLLTFNLEGAARFNGRRGGEVPGYVEISGNTLTVRETLEGTPTSVTFTRGSDPAHPKRVQIEMQAIFTGANWTGFRARARSSHTAPWSSWATRTYAAKVPGSGFFQIIFGTLNAASSVSGAQLTRSADPALWTAPNADFVPLGGRLDVPYLPAETDAWTGIQEFCASNLGAAWVTRDRVLMVRGREWLAGVGRTATPLDVGQEVEDLAWTVDPGDMADRLEVTYQPIDWELPSADSTPVFPVLWQADDVIELGPRETVEIVADLDGPASHLYGTGWWVPAWYQASLVNEYSVWSALPNRDGTGTQPPEDALEISVRSVSVSRAVITIRNTTTQRLFTVDRAGAPCIIWRSPRVGHLNNTAIIERGASDWSALNPLRIGLGAHVQRDVDAAAIADYIWARVSSQMWRADSVRVRLDWSRDIGDVVELTHERSGLSVKALVTKVGYSGQPGEVAQTVDLVLLPPTWADWDATWAGGTWDLFDATWNTSVRWTDFDNEPLRRL